MGAVKITSELRYEGRSNNERNCSPNNEPTLLTGRVSTTERARARLTAVSTPWLSWAGAGGLRPMTKKKLHHKHDEEEKVTGCKAHISSLRGLLQLQPALVAQCHLETWQRHQRHSGSP